MYAVSVLLFLVARKASWEHKHKLTHYFSSTFAQLLKLSTICKSPLYAIMSTEHGNDRLITAHALFSSHVTFCGFLGFVKSFFFWKLLTGIFPLDRWRKPLCVKGRQNYPARLPRWLARKIFFWPISGTDFDTSGTRLVRKSAQGLFSPWNKLARQKCRSPENIASSRPVAPGSPRKSPVQLHCTVTPSWFSILHLAITLTLLCHTFLLFVSSVIAFATHSCCLQQLSDIVFISFTFYCVVTLSSTGSSCHKLFRITHSVFFFNFIWLMDVNQPHIVALMLDITCFALQIHVLFTVPHILVFNSHITRIWHFRINHSFFYIYVTQSYVNVTNSYFIFVYIHTPRTFLISHFYAYATATILQSFL